MPPEFQFAAVEQRIENASRACRRILQRVTLLYLVAFAIHFCFLVAFIRGGLLSNNPEKIQYTVYATLSVPILAAKIALSTKIVATVETIRVDRISGAPTVLRQIAYASYIPEFGRWLWLCYIASPISLSIIIAAFLLFTVTLGFHWGFLFLVAFNVSAAAVFLAREYLMYTKGIDELHRTHIIPSQFEANRWAEFSAFEHSKEAIALITKVRTARR